jgi:UDP-N-acetylglucosamine transferase subunit ALG13
MIFVTVGTHEQPFDRLVRAAEELAGEHEVCVQTGTSTVPTPRCRASAWLTPAEVNDHVARASTVICHGGPSTIFEARAHGHHPIVVPRDVRFEEHVDAHQVRFAEFMRPRLHVVMEPSTLGAEVAAHSEVIKKLSGLSMDDGRSEAFASDLEALCEQLLRSPTSRQASVRDRFRGLRRWWERRG